jgi:cob(I)alamin adenosyltransferase
MEPSINQDQLKALIKAALVEVLEERQDLLLEAIAQALEDMAFARAIEEGESSELIKREAVFNLLEDRA